VLRAIDDDGVTAEEFRKLLGLTGIRKRWRNATPTKRTRIRARTHLVVVRNQNVVAWMRLKQIMHHHPPNCAHTTKDHEITFLPGSHAEQKGKSGK